MVTGNRYRHLVRVRRDIQVAVNNNHFDVAVVVGSYREVILRQTHVIVSNIGALRSIFAFRLQLDRDRLLAHVGRVAGHALLCGVVYLAFVVTGNRYRHLVRVRRDRKRARIVSNSVVSGDTRSSGLIAGSRSDIRSDLQRSTKCAFNCRHIGIQRSIVGEGTGKLAAIIFFAIGLSRDRQRQRVVDGDDIAFGFDRDRLGRVIAVDRQVLPLIGRNRLCRVLGPDCLLGRHIIRDRGRGALQVVVNRDRSLVQLKVRIVGVRLIDAVSVLTGSKLSLIAHMLRTIIASPIVDNVRVRAGSSRRAGSRSGRRLDRLGRGIDSTPAGAVGSDRVVDGYIVLFPNRIQIFDRSLLIGCNLRNGISVIGVSSVRIRQPRSCRCRTLRPALEGITRTGRSIRDINCFVDFQGLIRIAASTVAAYLRVSAIVHIPVDVRRLGFLDGNKHSTELDGVGGIVDDLDLVALIVNGVNRIAVIIEHEIAALIDGLFPVPSYAFDALDHAVCVALQNGERRAGLDGSVCRLVRTRVIVSRPGLDDPVREALTFRCSGRSKRARRGGVDVGVGVGFPNVITVHDILDRDALGAFGRGMPLTVQVELLGDPETVAAVIARDIGVPGCAFAELVHGVRHIHGLIIRSGDSGVVQNKGFVAEQACAGRIKEPSVKLIARTGAHRGVQFAAGRDTEVHRLGIGAPVQRIVIASARQSRLRVQEHAVLVDDPLGIHGDTVDRHRREVIGDRAELIRVPARKRILQSGGLCIKLELVIARDICSVRHVLHGIRNRIVRGLVSAVAAAVIIRAVQEVDVINIAEVVQTDRAIAVKVCTPLLVISRIRLVLGITGQIGKLFGFCRIKIRRLEMDLNILEKGKLLSVKSYRIRSAGQGLDIILDVISIVGTCRIVGQTEGRAFRLHVVDKAYIGFIVENAAALRLP